MNSGMGDFIPSEEMIKAYDDCFGFSQDSQSFNNLISDDDRYVLWWANKKDLSGLRFPSYTLIFADFEVRSTYEKLGLFSSTTNKTVEGRLEKSAPAFAETRRPHVHYESIDDAFAEADDTVDSFKPTPKIRHALVKKQAIYGVTHPRVFLRARSVYGIQKSA